jgi:hypothetical protein
MKIGAGAFVEIMRGYEDDECGIEDETAGSWG